MEATIISSISIIYGVHQLILFIYGLRYAEQIPPQPHLPLPVQPLPEQPPAPLPRLPVHPQLRRSTRQKRPTQRLIQDI